MALDELPPEIAGLRSRADAVRGQLAAVTDALGQVIVGQAEVIEQVLAGLVAGGHVLLEGVPGLGKTLLVRTLAGSPASPSAGCNSPPT